MDYIKCPKCGEPNKGINGNFFLADGIWVCLNCQLEEVDTDAKTL
jgi:transposase